jgi:hypothetical protein
VLEGSRPGIGPGGAAKNDWSWVEMEEYPVKMLPTIGCCGIDCGLCPRYYTVGSSRCPGCAGPDFFDKRPTCGFITCCVKRRKLEVCSQCDEFPCSRFEYWADGDSFVTHRRSVLNLRSIREVGLDRFMDQQRKRMSLLKIMLDGFDDGRSRSLFCTAAALLPIAALEESLHHAQEQVRHDKAKSGDAKTKAGILRGLLDDCSAKAGVDLSLRHKKKGGDGR